MDQMRTVELPLSLDVGPDCDRCIRELQEELARIKGIRGAAVNNARTSIRVEYDPDTVTLARIEGEARRIGADLAERIDHVTFELRDVDCPDCAASIERGVSRLPGVLWAASSFATAQLHVEFERGKTSCPEIVRLVSAHGARARVILATGDDQRRTQREPASGLVAWWVERRRLIATMLATILTIAGAAVQASGHRTAAADLLALAIAIGGYSTARAAWLAARNREVDMNSLMTIAVIGAAAIGEWTEGATVVTLFSIGNLLQAGAMERTRRSIGALIDLTPKSATVVRGRGEFQVPVEQVRLGEQLLVKPGERIPLDGIVTGGASDVNQAPITGESVPVTRATGDAVYAGTLNGEGALSIEVTSVLRDSLLSRIVHRVEEAQAQRAPIQRTIDRFARKYTPCVTGLAATVAVGPPAAITAWAVAHGQDAPPHLWTAWLLRALALLLISCPCALVISTPVAVVTAIGQAARRGALVKGGAFLEELGRIRTVLFDKTGTLTHARFRIDDVIPLDSLPARDLLRIAGAIERHSEHPLAAAFADQPADACCLTQAVTDYRALPGLGASASVQGTTYWLGNPALMASRGIELDGARVHLSQAEATAKTTVILADDQHALGLILLSDAPRDGVAETLRDLTRLGIARQVMLTGDNVHVAAQVAEKAGISEFKACLLPDEKLALVRDYQQQHGPVAMVGDGINDAPALAAANVGIAMGAAASDTALETADVALLGQDLSPLPYLIGLSRRTHTIVKQNIAVALATKGALIVAAIVVGLPLWLAVVGDVGVSLLVTANALRLRAV